MESFVETIRHTAFFSGFSREDLARVAGKLEEEKFLAAQVIISQGEMGDALYVIHSGAVEVILENNGVYVKKGALGPHECFGEMALITGEKRSATVRTLVDTVVLKLGKEAWEEMLAKHPSLTLHFCKVLTRRLTETERDIWRGQGTVNLVMENFLAAQPTHVQEFLMQSSILKHLDPQAIQSTLSIADPTQLLTELSLNYPVFIRTGKSGSYEYHDYLRDFLSVKLEQKLTKKQRDELHGRFASYFSSQAKWGPAIYHYIKAEEWKEALELIEAHRDQLLESETPKEILEWLDALPLKLSRAHGPLARLRAEAQLRLGDVDAAIRTYQEFLAQKQVAAIGALETAGYYQELAELHRKKGEVGEALGCLRVAAGLVEESRADMDPVQAIHSIEALQQKKGLPEVALQWGKRAVNVAQKLGAQTSTAVLSRNKKWLGLLLAFALGWGLWQMPPPTPLDERGVHFLATLVGAVILWILGVFDEYVVAIMLLFSWLVFGVVPPQIALAGFSDSSWIFVLGVLGIGAAVTRSGLLYRTALQILRRTPPHYYIYALILTASVSSLPHSCPMTGQGLPSWLP